MSSIGTGYDLSVSQFSPDGRVFQVEYASKAVEASGTVVALRGRDGVVVAVEKMVNTDLHELEANKRVWRIDESIGMSAAGLLADARKIAEIARREAADYRQEHGYTIPLSVLANRVGQYKHAYTLYSAVRPFGVNAIFCSWDEIHGAQLYMTEPSGLFSSYFACAAGKATQTAKTELEKLKFGAMSIGELANEAAKIIAQVHDDAKDKTYRLELAWVGEASRGRFEEVPETIYGEAVDYAAKAAAADSGDED